VCRLLIAQGASVEAKDNYGSTPVLYAAYNGDEDVCRLLIENKASVEAKDNDGKTPLIWAAENDHEGVYKLLIENKAAIEVQDKRGLTPLSWAAGKGHGNLCKLLIANKASVEAKDNNRETPLALAAANGRDAVCALLIDTQLEPIKKGKAAIVTLLAIAKKRRAKLSCHMPYDVAKIIARHAFAMIQQSKRPIIEQINCIASKEERTKWLQYAKHQMNTPVVYAQDIHGNQAHNAIPAEDIKPKESRLVEKCTLQ